MWRVRRVLKNSLSVTNTEAHQYTLFDIIPFKLHVNENKLPKKKKILLGISPSIHLNAYF